MRRANQLCRCIGIFTLCAAVDGEDLADGDGCGTVREAVDNAWDGGEGGLHNARSDAADGRVNEVGCGCGLEEVADHIGGRLCRVGNIDSEGGEYRHLVPGSNHLRLGGGGGNDGGLDGGGSGDGNSGGSGLAVVSHCGAEPVLVRRVLDVPYPAVGVSNGVGARHDVAVSAFLPLLGVARDGVVDGVSVVVPRHGTRDRHGLLEDGAHDRRICDGVNDGIGRGADDGCVVDGHGGMVNGDWGAVKGDGYGGSGGPDEGVSGSLVGDGGVGVRDGGGGRHRPHLLHVLHVVRHRRRVGDRVHDGVRDGANGGGSLMRVDGGRRV